MKAGKLTLDRGPVTAYRDQRRLRASPHGPPAESGKRRREGRPVPTGDHGAAEHEQGQPHAFDGELDLKDQGGLFKWKGVAREGDFIGMYEGPGENGSFKMMRVVISILSTCPQAGFCKESLLQVVVYSSDLVWATRRL